MEIIMLDGWTPILLIGAAAAVIIFLASRKISRKVLFTVSSVLSLICAGAVIYSREVVGGWEGVGLLFVTMSIFVGVWVGTIGGAMVKNS